MQPGKGKDQHENQRGITGQELYSAASQRLGFRQPWITMAPKAVNPKPEPDASDDEQRSKKVNPMYKRLDKIDKDTATVIAAKAKKRQQEGVKVLFRPGIDTDGDPDHPETWVVYDPPILPEITATDFHDSTGVHGFPCNVFLGDRAVVAVIDAGISETNRRWRWSGCFGADGRVPSAYRNTGRAALTEAGDIIRIKLTPSKGKPSKYLNFSGDSRLPENKNATLSGKYLTITATPAGGNPTNPLAKNQKQIAKGGGKGKEKPKSTIKVEDLQDAEKRTEKVKTPVKRGNSDTPDSSAKKAKIFGALQPIGMVVSSDSEEPDSDTDKASTSSLGMAPVIARRLAEELCYARGISRDAIQALVDITTIVKHFAKKDAIKKSDVANLLESLQVIDDESGKNDYKANVFAKRLAPTTSFMEGLSEALGGTPNLCALMTENIPKCSFTEIDEFIASGAATDIPAVTTSFGQFSRPGYGGDESLVDSEDSDNSEAN